MRTKQPRLPWWRGWLERGTSQWGRENNSWMLMPTLRSSGTGHLVDFTMNTYAKWCSSMTLSLTRVSMTKLSARAGRSPWQNETSRQNPLPWSSSTLTPPGRILQTFTRMFFSFGDCLGGVTVKRGQKNAFARIFWTPSKNASSLSGHLHHWRQNTDGTQLVHLAQAPTPSLLPQSLPIMRGLWLQRGNHVRKYWPWQDMPIDRHWQPWHYWKIRLRGWAIPSATSAQATAYAWAANDAWAATDEGDPRLQDVNSKSPSWCHAMGTLLKGELSHPGLPTKAVGDLCWWVGPSSSENSPGGILG